MSSDIPDWAKVRACVLMDEAMMRQTQQANVTPYWTVRKERIDGHYIAEAFACYIASKEQPPVDPLVLIARQMCGQAAEEAGASNYPPESYLDGHVDCSPAMRLTVAALKRGIELAKEQS